MVNPAARSGTSPHDAWLGTPLYLHGHPNLGERVSSFSESRVPYGSARCCSPASWRLRGLHYFSILAADQHHHFSFIFVRNFRIRGRATGALPGRATRVLPGLSPSPASPFPASRPPRPLPGPPSSSRGVLHVARPFPSPATRPVSGQSESLAIGFAALTQGHVADLIAKEEACRLQYYRK